MALSKATSAAAAPSKHTPLEPPDGAFDVTVSPGEPLQAAIARAKPGATVLLLPGEHAGPLVLGPSTEVHIYGRGKATLTGDGRGPVVTSTAARASLTGVAITQRVARSNASWGLFWAGRGHVAVCVRGGSLTLRCCDVRSNAGDGVAISGGAGSSPEISGCRRAVGTWFEEDACIWAHVIDATHINRRVGAMKPYAGH